jgi:hypothetical protein
MHNNSILQKVAREYRHNISVVQENDVDSKLYKPGVNTVEFFVEKNTKIAGILEALGLNDAAPPDSTLYDLAAERLRTIFPDAETRLSREHIRLYHLLLMDPHASLGRKASYSEYLAERVLFSLDRGRRTDSYLERTRTGNLAVVLSSPSFRESFQRFNLALVQSRDRFVQSIVTKISMLVDELDRDNDADKNFG